MLRLAWGLAGWLAGYPCAASDAALDPLRSGQFSWTVSKPLLAPADRPEDPCYSLKDPTVVRHAGRWHLFCTIRSQKRSHQIEYLRFAEWGDVPERQVLAITNGYYCAPQVFYFTPHRRWYLIYQATDTNRPVALQPAFSTTATLEQPESWTAPQFLYARHPDRVKMWIDFWVICDDRQAHLFFTSLDGQLWRAATALADFPQGWGPPEVELTGDIFEASHTYRLRGRGDFLTLVEAQGPQGRRYYKAYLAERLDGAWRPLADRWEQPFAGATNLFTAMTPWADSVSHGELLRVGTGEDLEVDPDELVFLFQGVADGDRVGRAYGEIPWRLGLLRPRH